MSLLLALRKYKMKKKCTEKRQNIKNLAFVKNT